MIVSGIESSIPTGPNTHPQKSKDKKTTSLNDFLDEATPAPSPAKPASIPDAFQEIQTEGTQSMGTFLDAVGADLSQAPDEHEEVIHDPLARGDQRACPRRRGSAGP